MPLTSCIQDLTIDFRTESGVAVDCVLKMQETQTLRLYMLKEIYGAGERAITDATVILSAFDEDSGEYSDVAEFKHQEGMTWSAFYLPEYGVKYKLTVNLPGKGLITAETRFPEDLRLLEYHGFYDLNNLQKFFGTVDSASFLTPYYEIHKAKTVMSLREKEISSDSSRFKFVNGKPVPFKDYREVYQDSCKLWVFPHVDSEYEFHDHPDSIWFERYKYPERYDFRGASKPYVEFAATDHPFVDKFNLAAGSVSDLKWCNLPIKEFVTGLESWKRLYSNLSQWPVVICPDLPLHHSFLRIAHPANFVNQKYEHEVKYDNSIKDIVEIPPTKHKFYIIAEYSESFGIDWRSLRCYLSCTIETHFVSEEYDSYLRDLYSAKGAVGNFILSAYETKHIYSNVIGGYGIFGADYVTWDEWVPY